MTNPVDRQETKATTPTPLLPATVLRTCRWNRTTTIPTNARRTSTRVRRLVSAVDCSTPLPRRQRSFLTLASARELRQPMCPARLMCRLIVASTPTYFVQMIHIKWTLPALNPILIQ
eukprot:scaffold128737_cov32-Cyclotella_meneghiniana.AAC.2